MGSLRVGVVGAGSMGWNHCRVYSELPDVVLVGVCDSDGKVASKAAGAFGCDSYTDLDVFLSKAEPDAVSVVVPTQHHAKASLACIESGTSVLVEKPIADTIESAKAIIEAADEAGARLTVGHIERFNPAVQELNRRLLARQLGRIYSIRATRVGPFPNRIRDVGVVIDLAVHDVDVMRYITGSDVGRVYAETEKRIHTSHEDMLSGLLKFKNGVVGVLDVNWLTPEKIRELTVTGERGMFRVDYIKQELTFYENSHVRGKEYNYQDILMGVSEGDVTNIRVQKREPLRIELESFINSIRKNQAPEVSGLDGLRSLEVALAIVESSTKNTVISL